jgi:RNA polymerase sigma-70 factor, ECF subfamily
MPIILTYRKPSPLIDFEDIYTVNYDKLFRVALKMVGNKDSAGDIVQEVFINFYCKQNDGHSILYPSKWLYRVVTNKCIDFLKHAAKFQTIRTSELEQADDPADEKEQSIVKVNLALSTLKPRDRALMVLYSEGKTYREIAELTGIRFASVGKTLARTLGKLETELKKQKYELY